MYPLVEVVVRITDVTTCRCSSAPSTTPPTAAAKRTVHDTRHPPALPICLHLAPYTCEDDHSKQPDGHAPAWNSPAGGLCAPRLVESRSSVIYRGCPLTTTISKRILTDSAPLHRCTEQHRLQRITTRARRGVHMIVQRCGDADARSSSAAWAPPASGCGGRSSNAMSDRRLPRDKSASCTR